MLIGQKVQQADVVTDTNRIYPLQELESIVEQIKLRQKNHEVVFGELGFPKVQPGASDEYTRSRSLSIQLDNVSHKVLNPRIEDGWLVADIESTNNLNGSILDKLAMGDHGLKFRLRLVCEFVPSGIDNVHKVKDASFISIDAISNAFS